MGTPRESARWPRSHPPRRAREAAPRPRVRAAVGLECLPFGDCNTHLNWGGKGAGHPEPRPRARAVCKKLGRCVGLQLETRGRQRSPKCCEAKCDGNKLDTVVGWRNTSVASAKVAAWSQSKPCWRLTVTRQHRAGTAVFCEQAPGRQKASPAGVPCRHPVWAAGKWNGLQKHAEICGSVECCQAREHRDILAGGAASAPRLTATASAGGNAANDRLALERGHQWRRRSAAAVGQRGRGPICTGRQSPKSSGKQTQRVGRCADVNAERSKGMMCWA